MVLEKLDEIQWDQLSDPYGWRATDVPDYFRELLSPDKAVRDKAQDKLSLSLCILYQLGTVTPIAIPFLIELLEHDDTPDKKNVLHLLLDCCLRSEATPEEMKNPHIQLEVEVGQQVTKGLDVYIRHLNHPDWETRLATILLLAEGAFPRSLRQRLKLIYEQYKTQEQHPKICQYFEEWDQGFASFDSSSSEVSDDAPDEHDA